MRTRYAGGNKLDTQKTALHTKQTRYTGGIPKLYANKIHRSQLYKQYANQIFRRQLYTISNLATYARNGQWVTIYCNFES
jgi:hypothetical protein